MEAEVRLVFEDALWLWLDDELDLDLRPMRGQAIQVVVARPDGPRLVPCRLVQEGKGGSLQVSVSGRSSKVQRREDVRARVSLPPASAVRLTPVGRAADLVGVSLVDLSAGGVRFHSSQPIYTRDRLKLILRLDEGEPLTPTVQVLAGGAIVRGRFLQMPERERRRIVQFVYRQELAERLRVEGSRAAD